MWLFKSNKHASDIDLARESRKGNKKAFDQLVLRHQKQIYAISRGFAHNHQDADEITQEAFINAYIHINQFNEKGPFYSWLYRICVNTSLNFLKKRDKFSQIYSDIIENSFDETDLDANPLKKIYVKEINELIKEALQSIPSEMQTVFVMRTFGELSYKDIAESLNISIGTVMSRLSRARKHLQKKLSPIIKISEKL